MTEIKVAEAADVDGILALVDEFSQGHPSRDHARSREAFEEAYFGERPIAEIVIAVRGGKVIGMLEWHLMFDMFWTSYHGLPEWLFVSSGCRGSGVVLSLLAFACDRVRQHGGEAMYIYANENTAPLLDRFCYGNGPSSYYHLSNEAFHQVADLAGKPPRIIAAHLPAKELCRVRRDM